jgi:ApaG protein
MDYEKVTEGIRVSVRPSFSFPYSEPEDGRFVFTYLVEMENQSEEVAQLLFRHWYIHDSQGEDSEVDGEGVVGEQPTLAPGKSHVYESFCVLRSPVGFMEGYFTFVRPTGEEFRVPVPRFELRAPWTVGKGPEADVMN